ncbi:MAG: SOS response-associated peptidase [Kofleriaceae bacterium]
MCGRYTVTRQDGLIEDLEAVLDPAVAASEWWKPRFNVAPTQPAPVVTFDDDTRVIELMRWGLIPFWGTKPGTRPPLMINARVESLEAKQVFRDALAHRRCLVPADGFFEWKRGGGKGAVTTPMWIHPEPHRFVAFAGLWARARAESGREVRSFTIVTGPPNELVRPIHDRMPIVLARSTWAAWLDPSLDGAGAHALLGVPAIGDWRADAVSTWVNKADHDDPACIVPVPAAQGSLF